MEYLEALLGLVLTGDIGSIRLRRLLETFGTPQEVLNASVRELCCVKGISPAIAEGIRSLDRRGVERELALSRKAGIRLCAYTDPAYPFLLKEIYDPPPLLFIKGSLTAADTLSVGIVGSRRASLYGLSAAERFAAELAGQGFTVISGLARGIDTAAHRGALKARGRTVAVLGSGLGNIYPAENKKIAEEIALAGALVSEFPWGMKPLRQNFPRRNRLISGLSRGVLVVEAARNSGALITADCALEQGREVFALPGRIDCPTSFGVHELIKQGARLVSGSCEIAAGLLDDERLSQPGEDPSLRTPIGSLPEQEAVLACLSGEPLHLDELSQRTRLAISRISAILVELQLQKKVQSIPGALFVRS